MRKFKIDRKGDKWVVFVRFMLFWWISMKKHNRLYSMFKRDDAEFDTLDEALEFVSNLDVENK